MHLVTETRPPVQRERLIKLEEVERLTSLRKSSIYKMQRDGSFPRAVQVTARCVAWRESQVLQWVQDRCAAASATTSQAAA